MCIISIEYENPWKGDGEYKNHTLKYSTQKKQQIKLNM